MTPPENPYRLLDNQLAKVWRYMSFGRFVWFLQSESLWLSRADRLGDEWEMFLTEAQIESVVSEFSNDEDEGVRDLKVRLAQLLNQTKTLPGDPSGLESPTGASVSEEARPGGDWATYLRRTLHDSVSKNRRQTYVNCWTISEHESFAMWRTYCAGIEGVAVCSTIGDLLVLQTMDTQLLPVRYFHQNEKSNEVGLWHMAAQKRVPFAYEREVRLIRSAPYRQTEGGPLIDSIGEPPGVALKVDLESLVKAIVVHPQADSAFEDSVRAATVALAPTLAARVAKSEMASPRPY